ncbi:16360_t:CDS:2, partial [Cetraspora pellucida]
DNNNYNASNKCYNLANSNNDTITDKDNNPINEEFSILLNEPNDISNLPNLKEINNITSESSYKEKTKKSQSSQLQIDQIIYNNPKCKRHKDQKFVELLIKN